MFAEKLKENRRRLNLTQHALAKKLRVSQPTVGSWEVGRTEPSIEVLNQLSELFDLSVDELLGKNNKLLTSLYVSEKPKIYIPLLNVSAGKFMSDDKQYDDEIELPESFEYLKDKAFAIKVNGESMNKVMQHGSIALCEDISKTGYTLKNGDFVVAEHDGEYTVKKFVETSSMIILDPVSTESTFKPIVFDKSDEYLNINILGVVKRNYIDFE